MTQPWQTLDRVETAQGPLELRRRGERDFMITIRGRVLMTSTAHRSEDSLARIACEGLADRRDPPRVLIGGLGMGFTLRAALDAIGPNARVTVAELNEHVVAWCRGPLAPLTNNAVGDRRVNIEIDDVTRVIARTAAGRNRFDAIAFDLYDGPQARVRDEDPLYGRHSVAQTRRALHDGGVFAVWCEKHSPGFERALRSSGFRVEAHREGRGGSVHLIYVGRAVTNQRFSIGT
jgi:spermidine synthase